MHEWEICKLILKTNILVLQKDFPNNLITFSCVYVLTFRDIFFVEAEKWEREEKL